MNRKALATSLIVLVLIVVAAIKIIARKTPPDTRRQMSALVRVEKPQRQDIQQTVLLTGDVFPIQQAQIFSKVYGNLDRVYVSMGDYVREGQLLALIDTTELAEQSQQADATFRNTKANYERFKDLFGRSLASKQDLDNAETAMRVAEANHNVALTRLGYARITAPFAGFVTRRYLDAGAQITANNVTLFTLMDLSTVKIIAYVLEKDVPVVNVGVKATISVDAIPDKVFTGAITRLSQAVDPATRTMAIEIDVPNPDRILKPGMFAAISLSVGERPDAITVPSQALLKDDKGQFVYVADSTTARRRAVTAGSEQQSRTEIVSGLTGDENVITTGQQFIKDGGSVAIQK